MENGEAAVPPSGFRWLLYTTGPNPNPWDTVDWLWEMGLWWDRWLGGLSHLPGGFT